MYSSVNIEALSHFRKFSLVVPSAQNATSYLFLLCCHHCPQTEILYLRHFNTYRLSLPHDILDGKKYVTPIFVSRVFSTEPNIWWQLSICEWKEEK